MANKDKIIERVRKCLALAQGTNPHEAATALRQAQAMMRAHDISDTDLERIVRHKAQTTFRGKKPPAWHNTLVSNIGYAFGLHPMWSCSASTLTPLFVGPQAYCEIADYAHATLYRQVKKSRADYLKTLSKRLKKATKTTRADLFCAAWVSSACELLERIIPTVRQTRLTQQLVSSLAVEKQSVIRRDFPSDVQSGNAAISAGIAAGHRAQLRHGVGEKNQSR